MSIIIMFALRLIYLYSFRFSLSVVVHTLKIVDIEVPGRFMNSRLHEPRLVCALFLSHADVIV